MVKLPEVTIDCTCGFAGIIHPVPTRTGYVGRCPQCDLMYFLANGVVSTVDISTQFPQTPEGAS